MQTSIIICNVFSRVACVLHREYGEAWHKGGMLANKQNVFDDFIAATEYLVKEKYTQPSRLTLHTK